jgi:hypothetical protein
MSGSALKILCGWVVVVVMLKVNLVIALAIA